MSNMATLTPLPSYFGYFLRNASACVVSLGKRPFVGNGPIEGTERVEGIIKLVDAGKAEGIGGIAGLIAEQD